MDYGLFFQSVFALDESLHFETHFQNKFLFLHKSRGPTMRAEWQSLGGILKTGRDSLGLSDGWCTCMSLLLIK